MSHEEKGVWAYLVAALGSFAVYVGVVLSRADGRPLAEVPYVAPLLWTVAVSLGIKIAVGIALDIARPSESRLADARDREISRFGDWVGSFVLAVGVVGALALALTEVDHFWIANAIYAAFVLQAVVASAAKLRAYRVGI